MSTVRDDVLTAGRRNRYGSKTRLRWGVRLCARRWGVPAHANTFKGKIMQSTTLVIGRSYLPTSNTEASFIKATAQAIARHPDISSDILAAGLLEIPTRFPKADVASATRKLVLEACKARDKSYC